MLTYVANQFNSIYKKSHWLCTNKKDTIGMKNNYLIVLAGMGTRTVREQIESSSSSTSRCGLIG